MPDRAAFDRAAAVQRQFEQEFLPDPNIVGIGLGQNAAADGFIISVQLSETPPDGFFPKRFGGLEVLLIVAGQAVTQ